MFRKSSISLLENFKLSEIQELGRRVSRTKYSVLTF